MFTTTITIKLIGLNLKESMEILDHIDLKSRLQKGWFDILKSNIEADNIKNFRYHDWNSENQTITATYYSDTAEQSRIFRHSLIENPDFIDFINQIQNKGHEISLDSGIAPPLSSEKIALDGRYEKVKFTLE